MTLRYHDAAVVLGRHRYLVPERGRRPDIQGLRAIAVLMVVAFHAGLPVPGGFVGVDVFFVISGFVITAMLMREWATTGRIRFGRFYVRRFKRLTPALALIVSVVMLASALLLSPIGSQQTAALTAMGAMVLAANGAIAQTTGDYFDARADTNPLLHTWSLSVEEQFYLVFPAVLLASWVLGRRFRRPGLSAAFVVGLVGALSLAAALGGSIGIGIPRVPDLLMGFYGPVTRAWEFAAGALLALGGARLKILSPRLAVALALAGVGTLTASLLVITSTTPFPGAWTLLPVIGTLFLIVAGSSENRLVARTLGSGPMVAIGDRSYSIYLWHWPFIAFGQLMWPGSRAVLLAAAALCFIPAYASYRWVEQPIRALPQAGRAPFQRLVAATVLTPLVLAVAVQIAALNGFWNASVQAYQAAIQQGHVGYAAGCTREAYKNPSKCTWNADAAGQPVYLVGDSNADHFSDALVAATRSKARPLVTLSQDGCSYLAPSLVKEDSLQADVCTAYWRNTNDLLLTRAPGLVVIANAYVGFDYSSSSETRASVAHPTQLNYRAKLDTLSTALSTAVRSLQGAGHTVLLVQAVPHWGDNKESLSWSTCTALDIVTVGCDRNMRLRDVADRQGPAAAVIAGVGRDTGADVLDLSPELCPGGTCSSVAADGLIRYRDGTHITVNQSDALAGTFAVAIAAAR